MLPEHNNCNIAIIGLGYVGLPLALQFIICQKKKNQNNKVIGYDINCDRINQLKKGIDITHETNNENLNFLKEIKLTSNHTDLIEADVFIITVPTPIDNSNNPNLKPLLSATKTVGLCIKDRFEKGISSKRNLSIPVIIYESTVYPGATEEECVPIIEKYSGLKLNNLDCNSGFVCGYSPERINPGDKKRSLSKIIKVTSGSNEISSRWIDKFYNSIIEVGTYRAKNIKTAEAAKVIENTQRDINIALINEFSIIFKKLGLNTNEVLEAAGTKWNFLSFTPGLVGGHCIGVDPYYLTYKAQQLGYQPEMVLAGRRINNNMPKWIIDELVLEMAKRGMKVKNSNVLILGFTFKKNVPDLRNTKVYDLVKLVKEYQMNIKVFDPIASIQEAKKLYNIDLLKDSPSFEKFDVIIGAVAHKELIEIVDSRLDKENLKNKIVIDIQGLFEKWNINQIRL